MDSTSGLHIQVQAAEAAAGAAPVIVRNAGTLGAKDLHLENFSVSNGGKELIQVTDGPGVW